MTSEHRVGTVVEKAFLTMIPVLSTVAVSRARLRICLKRLLYQRTMIYRQRNESSIVNLSREQCGKNPNSRRYWSRGDGRLNRRTIYHMVQAATP